MGFLVVSDTVHVSYRPLKGSTWEQMLREVNRELQMGSFQAVPAGILVPLVFGLEEYLPHVSPSSRFI